MNFFELKKIVFEKSLENNSGESIGSKKIKGEKSYDKYFSN